MSQISLTASMRSNLLSLQNTQSLMDMTQERLSTGKKVNSAIDNPSSYYTAQSLNNRANDLSSLLDSMGQGVQTIKAANEGIETITAFVEQAKSLANSAMDTSKGEEIANYVKQFNEVLSQIKSAATDSIYKGTNLLNGDSLTVNFNEDRSSKLEVTGYKIYDKLAIATQAEDGWGSKELVAAQKKYDEAVALANKTYNANMKQPDADEAVLSQKLAEDLAKAQGTYDTEKAAALTTGKAAIMTSIEQVEKAITTLRSVASEFGNNYSIVQTRQDFTENLINVLTEGADNLTLADMNEESANMLALQTRQQLAINSLSLASQASQSVLKLF